MHQYQLTLSFATSRPLSNMEVGCIVDIMLEAAETASETLTQADEAANAPPTEAVKQSE